ncbi:MAG: inositol monophosphatase family protein [Desulfobacca sp.]|uniref:inositol monophosphatase family protein n=1 Tax=Desulfobacca sp. TaxID=2067990 RepID=UPI00404AACA5
MLHQIRQTAREAAREAGALLRRNFARSHQITLKGHHDPVTESDLQSQELIVARLSQAFPESGFVAEEAGLSASPANGEQGRWIIDPLDGTVNFAHNFPLFCVSIAWQHRGEVAYGVVYDPLREELFEAVKGQGAWLNDTPIRVSAIADLDRALLATGFPYNVAERLEETMLRLRRLLVQAQGVRRPGSAAIDLCYLAAGRVDGFWEEGLKPWDTAAAVLILEEAGGQVSTFAGAPFTLTSDNLAASNGRLHKQLLAALQV